MTRVDDTAPKPLQGFTVTAPVQILERNTGCWWERTITARIRDGSTIPVVLDHVHVLFRAQPKTELSKFINAYKSASSRLLKQEFPGIRRKLWKEYFWSRSFCLLTTGDAPIEVIRKYIENQGEKGVE